MAAFNVNVSSQENELSGVLLANVEALAGGESSSGHSLTCGKGGIRMCKATCGIHQVTMENYGDGKSSTFTCS
ncbi:MAG: NVEALA domain-containing protein [Bacteroidales bacterium]